MSLSANDQFHATRAEGYLGLGMTEDAAAELDKISLEATEAPEVLMVRLALYQVEQRWAAMEAAARKLVHCDPGESQWLLSLAYATRRAESIEMARLILLEALDRFPGEPIVPYNLACYDCQLGNLASATQFLETALRLNPQIKAMALEDEDLRPLWGALRAEKGTGGKAAG